MCGSSLLHFPSYCWRFSRPCKLWHQVSDIHPTCSHRNLSRSITLRDIQKICKTFLKIAYISFLLFWDYTFPALHVPSGLCGVIHRSLPTYLPPQPKVEINPFFKRKICYTTLHFQYPFSYISAYNDKGSPPNTP